MEPTLALEYTIPYEDVDATPDEVVDSRRHQFLAFCRGTNVQEPYPTWVTWKDADAAKAKGLTPPDLADEDVLETSPEWKDCFVRITSEAQRRKITFAEAMKGVSWDLTGVTSGPYLIHGYTWEPAFNAYWPTTGYVQIIDGTDRSMALPGLGIYYGDIDGSGIIWADETLKIRGCPYALPDSKVTAYWSQAMPIAWVPFASDLVIDGESEFEVEFVPPAEAAGGLRVMFRLDLVDPLGRKLSAHVPHLATVLAGDTPEMPDTCDGNGFIAEESCGDDSSTSMSPTTGTGPSTSDGDVAGSTPGVDTGAGSGCACSTSSGARGAPLCLLFILLARRRHSSTIARTANASWPDWIRMSTSTLFIALLAALPLLACTASPDTTTTATTGAQTTHDEPTSSTHASTSEYTIGTTSHGPGSETTGHPHEDTDITTGGASPIDAYCACMLVKCHDQYHGTWGEDHEASEAMCAAAAAAVPSVGMPATMGNSIECRQHYCDLGEAEPGACDSAIGGGACV